MKIELGGGRKPLNGYVNIDLIPTADVVLDLERVGAGTAKLPFEDDSVDEIFSSHCLEHVDPYSGVLLELARVSKMSAKVEIRTPHPGSDMACCAGHKHVLSEQQVKQWEEFASDWWPSGRKMLKLLRCQYVPTALDAVAAQVFPGLAPIHRHTFLRNTCHEVRYFFRVVLRGGRSG